jgi:outer membrane protein
MERQAVRLPRNRKVCVCRVGRDFCGFFVNAQFVYVFAMVVFSFSSATADTINDALAGAYTANPQLNAQRANLRAVDENLPKAKGQFLPQLYGSGSAGALNFNLLNSRYDQSAFGGVDGIDLETKSNPVTALAVVSMNIFNGFRGINGINTAQAEIHQSREFLKNIEISILAQAVAAYLNVLRETAVFGLRSDYVEILQNQVQITRDRLKAGEATMTDVEQALQFLSQANGEKVIADTNLRVALAAYKQVTQRAPNKLAPARNVDQLLPKTLDAALSYAKSSHPAIVAARYNVDINEYSVKIAEGALAPTVDLQGRVGQDWNFFGTPGQRLYQAGAYVQVRVPIYEGGISYSNIRQAKEKLGESRLLFDQQINLVNQQVESAWASWKNSEAYLKATKMQVENAELALSGLREELKFGQRTTWDVLNYQQTLTNARIAFVTAQRERILSSYNLLAACGKLSAKVLDLDVPIYNLEEHFHNVKNQFFGLEAWK